MKVIISDNQAGGIRVDYPTPQKIREIMASGLSESEAISEIVGKLNRVNPVVIESTDLPGDRDFRNAWVKSGVSVSVDMPKARVIHMGRIREVRDSELKRLDQESLKNMESGSSNTAVSNSKQRLRDIPQNFDLSAFKTPQALKAAWPVGLPAPK